MVMKTKLTAVLAITFYCIFSPVFGQWERCNIDISVAYTCFIDVDDMNSDGDMDVVVLEYSTNMNRLSPFMQQNYQNARFVI